VKKLGKSELIDTDLRVSHLQKDYGFVKVSLKLFQIDLLRIHNSLVYTNNIFLAEKIMWYIKRIDEIEKKDTDYDRKIPKINPHKMQEEKKKW